MLDARRSALDLPLKILLAEDAEGSTLISYNSVVYLQARHGISPAVVESSGSIENIVEALAP